jgi:hypothetical protein
MLGHSFQLGSAGVCEVVAVGSCWWLVATTENTGWVLVSLTIRRQCSGQVIVDIMKQQSAAWAVSLQSPFGDWPWQFGNECRLVPPLVAYAAGGRPNLPPWGPSAVQICFIIFGEAR